MRFMAQHRYPHTGGLFGIAILSWGMQASCAAPCAEVKRSSVAIHLQDDSGYPLEEATVEYSVDGGEVLPCEAVAGAFICGWETEGLFEISASADGYAEVTVEVDVGLKDDTCHVDSQRVTVELDSLNCTAEAVPAAEVTVWSSTGQPATDASVTWVSDTELSAEAARTCGPTPGSNVFECAYEETGTLILQAFGGWEGATAVVMVQSDGCHPITESVVLDMADFDFTVGP